MPRGTYTVQMPEQAPMNNGVGDVGVAKQAQQDSSYKSCIQAMVIFVLLCVILILVSLVPWGSFFGKKKLDETNAAQKLSGNGTSTSTTVHETEATTAAPSATEPVFTTQATTTKIPRKSKPKENPTTHVPTTTEYNVDQFERHAQQTVIPDYTDENETKSPVHQTSTSTQTTQAELNIINTLATEQLVDHEHGRTGVSDSTSSSSTDLDMGFRVTSTEIQYTSNDAEEYSTIKNSEDGIIDTTATPNDLHDVVEIVTFGTISEFISEYQVTELETAYTGLVESTTAESTEKITAVKEDIRSTVEPSTINSPEETLDSTESLAEDVTETSSVVPTDDTTYSSSIVGDDASESSKMSRMEENANLTEVTFAETSITSPNEYTTVLASQSSEFSDYPSEEGGSTSRKQTTVSQTEFISTHQDQDQNQDQDTDQDQDQNDEQGQVSHEQLKVEESTLEPVSASTCTSGECKSLASKMLGKMNHSVDPCENFYQYTCGGLQTSQALKEVQASDDTFDRIRSEMLHINEHNSGAHMKFRNFYDSCVSYMEVSKKDRRSKARQVLDKIGAFHGPDLQQANNFTDLLLRLMLHHSTPLLDIILDVDITRPDRFALRLTPPVFKSMFGTDKKKQEACQLATEHESNLNSMYDRYLNCTKNYESYLDETEEAIRYLGLLESFKNKTKVETIILETRQTIDWDVFDGILGKLPSNGEIRKQTLSKTFDTMTVRQLQDDYSMLDWQVMISGLLNRSDPIPDHTVVQVYNKKYFEKMFVHLQSLDSRRVHNALLAMYAHDLYVDLVSTHDDCSRESYCLGVASELMEDVASSLYLSSFKAGALDAMRRDAQDMFDELRDAMRRQFFDESASSWMDEASRSVILSKLNDVKLLVDGGASVFLNDTLLNERMDEIAIEELNYLSLSVALSMRYRRLLYQLYTVTPDSTKAIWSHFLLPYSSNGVIIYRLNTIVIPYGQMWSLYEEKIPHYIRMARLGFVIAHELAHHFDKVGIMYLPGGGNEDALVTGKSVTSYDDFTYCVGGEYSFNKTYTTPDLRHVSFLVDADLVLNERIADDAGAALSLAAYRALPTSSDLSLLLPWLETDVTDEQLYFIAVAQNFCSKSSIFDDFVSLFEGEHLPSSLRVNNIMRNSGDFSSAFKCPVGGALNTIEKCDAFPKLTDTSN